MSRSHCLVLLTSLTVSSAACGSEAPRAPDAMPSTMPEDVAQVDSGTSIPKLEEACRAPLQAAGAIYESEGFYVSAHEARASAHGEVVVLVDEKSAPDAPERTTAKLVAGPGSAAPLDLASLLPAPGPVLGISEIRDDRLLILHQAAARTTVSEVDLAARALTWTRPLRDGSGLTRPHFDQQGRVIDAHQGPDVNAIADLRADSRVAYLEDGGYAVLAFVIEPGSTTPGLGTWLFGFNPDGTHRFRASVVPAVRETFQAPGQLHLRVGASGALHVLTRVGRTDRAAFEAAHGRRLGTPAFESLPVLLTFGSDGALTSMLEPDLSLCAAPFRATPWALDVRGDSAAWSGLCEDKSRVTVSRLEAGTTQTTPVALGGTRQHISSLLLDAQEHIYVAGRRDFAVVSTGSTVQGGTAFVARVDSTGAAESLCTFAADRENSFDLARSAARPLLILNHDHPLTHAEGEDLRGSATVRFVDL